MLSSAKIKPVKIFHTRYIEPCIRAGYEYAHVYDNVCVLNELAKQRLREHLTRVSAGMALLRYFKPNGDTGAMLPDPRGPLAKQACTHLVWHSLIIYAMRKLRATWIFLSARIFFFRVARMIRLHQTRYHHHARAPES